MNKKNEIPCWNCNESSGYKSDDLKLSSVTENVYCKNCGIILIRVKKK